MKNREEPRRNKKNDDEQTRPPAAAVEIRYAGPSQTVHYCDALLLQPPAAAKTLPVWTIVQAPKDQPPGWYTGTLEITANAKTFGRIGLDFWLKVPESPMHAAPRVGGNNGVGGNNALLEPGPDGPVPTVRFQMLREGVQDMEIRRMIIRGLLALPEDQRKPYRELLDEHLRRGEWARNILSQFELQYDWRVYAARVQQTAAELAGQPTQARWEAPPAAQETAK